MLLPLRANSLLFAAIGEAFRWIIENANKHIGSAQAPTYLIRSDSTYAMSSILGIFNGKKNSALISRVRELYHMAMRCFSSVERKQIHETFLPIAFSKVKGHSGHQWNDRADMLANQGARMPPDKPATHLVDPLKEV